MAVSPRCPNCARPSAPRGEASPYPFCSERCKLLDLGKWLDEAYRLPSETAGDALAETPAKETPDDGP